MGSTPETLGFPPSERRGFRLRRMFVISDLLVLWAMIALAAWGDTLRGHEIFKDEILAVTIVALLWVPIGISVGLYHVAGRGAATATVDEIGRVGRVATIWAWLALLARAAAEGGDPGMFQTVIVWIGSFFMVLLARALVRSWAQRRDWYEQSALVVGFPDDISSVSERFARHPQWGIRVIASLSPAIEVGTESNGGTPVPATGWELARVDPDGHRLDSDHVFIPTWPPTGEPETEPAPGGSGQIAVAAGADADLDQEIDPRSGDQVLVDAARSMGVSRVIIASPPGGLLERTALARALVAAGVQVDLVAGDAEVFRSSAELHHVEGLPLLSMPAGARPRSMAAVKRVFDVTVSIVSLILMAPLVVFCALLIKLDSEGPVFFRQRRIGRKGAPFTFLKLRSMEEGAEERLPEVADLSLHGQGLGKGIFKAETDPRITRVGRRLRRWSLDEVPQLWNVLRGEMSIVGPRPLPLDEDARIQGHLRVRHDVRPGITGPWQVMGRSDIPFDAMVRLDYAYVVHWSLGEDFRLILHTIRAVLRGRGAY